MTTIVRAKELKDDADFEPPMVLGRGICEDTVKGTRVTLSHNFIPPGGRNQRHYHVNADAGQYILKGRLKMFFGPNNEQEFIAEAGDYVFVPQGEIHGLMNMSETETAELIACMGGVGSEEEAHTIFVEHPWK